MMPEHIGLEINNEGATYTRSDLCEEQFPDAEWLAMDEIPPPCRKTYLVKVRTNWGELIMPSTWTGVWWVNAVPVERLAWTTYG